MIYKKKMCNLNMWDTCKNEHIFRFVLAMRERERYYVNMRCLRLSQSLKLKLNQCIEESASALKRRKRLLDHSVNLTNTFII